MAGLLKQDRVSRPDELYQLLVEAHRDLSPAESRQLDASLILLLANHIGDLDVIREALDDARRAASRGGPGGERGR